MRRRRVLEVASLGLAGAVAGCNTSRETSTSTPTLTEQQDSDISSSVEEGSTVGFEPVADGLSVPVELVDVPNTDLKYVANRNGVVSVLRNGQILESPLLDFRDKVVTDFWEQGFLGLALHPDFSSNRRLFVRYSAPSDQASHTFILSEVTVTDDYRGIEADSERVLFEFREPARAHNAGSILFGQGSELFVGVGESRRPFRAQDRGSLLGSILRIDVDARAGDKPYGVPVSNPFVGTDGRDEIYAYGFRNPWRLTYEDGTLLAGDVGEGRWEEINTVRNGNNYGWPFYEGTGLYEGGYPSRANPKRADSGDPAVTAPTIVYPHTYDDEAFGNSVVAGEFYDGPIDDLQGMYVFGDLTGGLLASPQQPDENGLWPIQTLGVGHEFREAILSFTKTPDGFYVLTARFGGETAVSGGQVYRIVAP